MSDFLSRFFNDVKPMVSRDHKEEHRAATMLELFFDLAVVIALASAASNLHHSFIENHIANGLITFSMVFFAVWWCWMNFTWFASSFDTDDTPFRILAFLNISGAIVFAAGIDNTFQNGDFSFAYYGFIIMRIALICLYIRASNASPEERTANNVIIVGMILCQIGWYFKIFHTPIEYHIHSFLVMAALELLVPYVAANWKVAQAHHHHIVERYSLLTIIVFGECLLACAYSFQQLAKHYSTDLLLISIGCLLITFCFWWLYFQRSTCFAKHHAGLTFLWGYGHYFVFGGATVAGIGMAASADLLTGHSHISAFATNMLIAGSVSVFLFSLWFIYSFPIQKEYKPTAQIPVVALLILGTPYLPHSVLLIGILLTIMVGLNIEARMDRKKQKNKIEKDTI
jgi:low temperature requirement protein LtrA